MIRFEADLEAAEEALVRYQQAAEIVTPSGETAAVLQSITSLETARAEAMVARETARKRLEVLQGGELAEETRTAVSGAVVAANPLISGMRSQLVNLEGSWQPPRAVHGSPPHDCFANRPNCAVTDGAQ